MTRAPLLRFQQFPAPLVQAGLGDRSSMGFAGTLLFTGQATALVVETGPRAEIGKIASLLGGVKQLKTPLLEQIEHFGRTVRGGVGGWEGDVCFATTEAVLQVSFICILIAVATFFIAWKGRDLSLFESFHAAVGVAVALIPEGASFAAVALV